MWTKLFTFLGAWLALLLRLCSIHPNANPCVPSAAEVRRRVFEVEYSIASRNHASPKRRAEQLSIEVPKFETWIDTAVIPPKSEFGCNEIFISVMGALWQGKSLFTNAYNSMKSIAEIADLLNSRRYKSRFSNLSNSDSHCHHSNLYLY